MNKFLMMVFIIFMFVGAVNAFTNSLDSIHQGQPLKGNNNFSSSQSNSYSAMPNSQNNPKEHTGFEHNDEKYINPQINDTRYNSNCQFGQCIPGGINPNNR